MLQENSKANVGAKYGEDQANQPLFDPELWLDAIGEASKGRMYGFGGRQNAYEILGPTTASTSCLEMARRWLFGHTLRDRGCTHPTESAGGVG